MSKLRTEFERLHCGGNQHLIRRDSTTGDYVLPSINDAWAGFQSGHAAGLERAAKCAEWQIYECQAPHDIPSCIRAMKEPK